jgi:hypothetical protein
MENKGEQHAQGVKASLEGITGADLSLKRKRKTEKDVNREVFEKIILALEKASVRSSIIGGDFQLNFTEYDETFYEIIDNLILMHFGKEASELIFFYVYERINPDGSVNALADVNGDIVPMNGPSDLWELIEYIRNKKTK